MSDFEWFGKVSKVIMINMFVWFFHSLLISEANSLLILMWYPSNHNLGLPL